MFQSDSNRDGFPAFIAALMMLSAAVSMAQTGSIHGFVTNSNGVGIEDAEVFILDTDIRTYTDNSGYYSLSPVAEAAPRYVVCALREGFLLGSAGPVDVDAGSVTSADIILRSTDEVHPFRTQRLELRFGCIIDRPVGTSPVLQPDENAVLDTLSYPDSVKVYLRPGEYIDPNDPLISGIADSIMSSLPESLRTRQTEVARRVYQWVVRTIDYDLAVFFPDDPTCGQRQGHNGAWGENINEWAYEPPEIVTERRAVCIEFERLASALLRAVNIPARPAVIRLHPVTQWWVQPPDSPGFWANMETSWGSVFYDEEGDSLALFPSRQEHELAFWWPDADAPIQCDWQTGTSHLWNETPGQYELYHDPCGLNQAQSMLNELRNYGTCFFTGSSPPEDQPRYEVIIEGSVIDLSTFVNGRDIVYRFPIFNNKAYWKTLDTGYWTSHPEWVVDQWIEVLSNDVSGNEIELYCVRLTAADVSQRSPSLQNGGFEEGGSDPSCWTEYVNPPGGASCQRVTVSHTGTYGAHISANTAGAMGSYRQPVTVEPGDHIRVSGWIHTGGVDENACIEIRFTGAGFPSPVLAIASKPPVNGDRGWTWVSGSGTAPAGTDDVVIGCSLYGPGQACFDDITVETWYSESFGPVSLSGEVIDGQLLLEWTVVPSASSFWLYGTPDDFFFDPAVNIPYENRLGILPPTQLEIIRFEGIGDPDTNWSYIIMAVDDFDSEITRSNRFGEFEW